MDEKKEENQKEISKSSEETTTEEKTEGAEQSKSVSGLSELYDKIKQENDRTENLVKRQEELAARGLLSGKSAGQQSEEKKEESPKEYKDRIEKGEV